MDYQRFGFEQFNRERRKFAGRRLGSDRRAAAERRVEERRARPAAVAEDRRNGLDRRVASERRVAERRSVDDRRNSVWTLLEGGQAS